MTPPLTQAKLLEPSEREFIIAGHSHIFALGAARAYAGPASLTPIEAHGGHGYFLMEQWDESGRGPSYWDALVKHSEKRTVVLVFHGNQHFANFMWVRQPLFDFIDPKDPGHTLCPGAVLVPRRMVKSSPVLLPNGLKSLITRLQAQGCHSVIVTGTPPVREDYVESVDEVRKWSNWREAASKLGVDISTCANTPAPLMKRLWRVVQESLEDVAREMGARFLPVPQEAIDAHGYLSTQFRGPIWDFTHANDKYGSLMIEHIIRAVNAAPTDSTQSIKGDPHMEFTRASRQDADLVERSFVEYKLAHPERLEYLVPTIEAKDEYECRPICSRPLTPDQLNLAKQLGPWGYAFDLSSDVSTEQLDSEILRREIDKTSRHEHIIRMSMFSKLLSTFKITGSWIDLGTNSGVIPVLLHKHCADLVSGIDISDVNIQKANLLKSLSGIEKLHFTAGDIFDVLRENPDNSFSVISALGIFYHLSDPLGLLALMRQKVKDFVIIDTIMHNFSFSGWIQTVSRHIKDPTLAHANDTRKLSELHPTYRGMVDALFQVGFETIVEVIPAQSILEKFPGTIYSAKNRRMCVAFK
jgi:2-polyprenyl-3-methyl-5-hydroxy-6-metoxy-1,4-benzoquinol methylase